jgi:hypothetical protein
MRFGVLQYALHLFLASYFVACDVFADVKRYRTRDDDSLERLRNLSVPLYCWSFSPKHLYCAGRRALSWGASAFLPTYCTLFVVGRELRSTVYWNTQLPVSSLCRLQSLFCLLLLTPPLIRTVVSKYPLLTVRPFFVSFDWLFLFFSVSSRTVVSTYILFRVRGVTVHRTSFSSSYVDV